MTAPGSRATVIGWPAYLDALEEWTRLAEAGLARGDDDDWTPPALAPDGSLPPELEYRARMLLVSVDQVLALTTRRRSELDRVRVYSRS